MALKALKETVDGVVPERLQRWFWSTPLAKPLALVVLLLLVYAVAVTLAGYIVTQISGDRSGVVYAVAVYGIPAILLAFAIFGAGRWLHARRMKRLAIERTEQAPGLFRTHPYGPEDHAIFERPGREVDEVVGWLSKPGRSLFYLFGASGVGKSSLINAGVIPTLERDGWMCLTTRVDKEPAAQVRGALVNAPGLFASKPPSNAKLLTVMQRASDARDGGKPVLLVIDQFEEFLRLKEEDARKPLAEAIRAVHANPLPGLRLLVVFRPDFTEDVCEPELPNYVPHDNARQVGKFKKPDAEAFLRRGHTLAPEKFAEIFQGLDAVEETPGRYRPITLNMVGKMIDTMGSRLEGDPRQLVERYVRDILENAETRDYAMAVLRPMTSPRGKVPIDVDTLRRETGYADHEIRATLNELYAADLVRPRNAERTRWEVSHDFLAHQITFIRGDLRSRWFPIRELLRVRDAHKAQEELRALGFALVKTDTGDGLALQDRKITDAAFARLPALLKRSNMTIRAATLENAGNITDLAPLSGLASLSSLDLKGTHIIDLAPLSGLASLSSLNLTRTPVTDLAPLSGLTSLSSLTLTGTGVTDLAPLSGLASLSKLNLSDTGVTDPAPLSGLASLSRLNLSYTHVTELAPLSGLTSLASLYLSHTPVSDLSSLSGLTSLSWLDLSNTEVTDVAPLSGLPSLAFLNLLYTRVTNLAPLKGMDLTIAGNSDELRATLE